MSFVVILFFIFKLQPESTADDEVCHNSVIMKKNSIFAGQSSTPLNCRREYVCITTDGKCEGLSNPEIIEVKNADELYNALAEKMSDCWWMFGEGKIDYVGGELTKNNYCSICSQILFDPSLKKLDEFKEVDISKEEVYKYMGRTKMSSDGVTYLEYLFGTKTWEDFSSLVQTKELNNFGEIEIGKQYFIIMGITSNVGQQWTVGGSAIGSLIGNFVPIKGSTFIGGAIGYGVGLVGEQISGTFTPEIGAIVINGNGVENQFMAPTIQEMDSDKFKLLNCEDILTYA